MRKIIPGKIYNTLFGHLYDQYPKFLEKEIVGYCETLLDIGCGPSSPIKNFSSRLKYTVGIDCYEPHLLQSQNARIHKEYRLMSALQVGEYFKPKSFDCVLASDLIEHLSNEDGSKLILLMEQIGKKKVIIFTPNGFVPQDGYNWSSCSSHLSGREVEEMRKMGFRIIGINGWKALRGKVGAIKWRPHAFWESVSLLTQLVTTKYPKYAFQLLCVKDL